MMNYAYIPIFWVITAFFVGRAYEVGGMKKAFSTFLKSVGIVILASIIYVIIFAGMGYLNNI